MRTFIERRLNQPYLRRISVLILALFLIFLTFSFATAKRGRTVFGPFLGADFGAFYVAGQIFNNYEPARIYDGALHRQLYKENFPDAPLDEELSYANAPFFIVPFIFLSRLPYAWAYLLWLVISVALYVAGFSILWRAQRTLSQEFWLTGLLLALSFWPFLVECLAGGQTSAVGFFWLALAIACEPRSKFWSGAALAVCAYKPTLLFLIVPMLLVTGRWLNFVGLLAGNVVLALVSLFLVGLQGCINFINRLLFYSSAATGTEVGLRSWKYVDVNAFMRLLLPEHTHLRWVITAVLVALVAPFIVVSWRRLRRESQRRLLWALTVTWTPVLNMYMGIYDSTILVLAALLLTAEFYKPARIPSLPFAYKCLLLLLYLSPLFTQSIALLTRVQVYTLGVAAFGVYQLLPATTHEKI